MLLERRAAGAFGQFQQKAGSFRVHKCDVAAASTNSPMLVKLCVFRKCSKRFDNIVYAESYMLETVLAGPVLRDDSGQSGRPELWIPGIPVRMLRSVRTV